MMARDTMRAMVLHRASPAAEQPLQLETMPVPVPGRGQVRLRVTTCGVCRTDLHVADGELPDAVYPIVPGHEIVGIVDAVGEGVSEWRGGERVGVGWLAWTCGACDQCRRGRENLCPSARFTGYTAPGGYAEYVLADARFVLRLPDGYSNSEAAPLLCAGLIGRRALVAAGDPATVGILGFGAAAHLVTQIAVAEGRTVFAFTRPGDHATQAFARETGAAWAGGTDERPPRELDAAILFAPAGELVPVALALLGPGGTAVCAGIHMSDIPPFPYRLLWGERTLTSVANLTREDGHAFMAVAAANPLRVSVREYALQDANDALADLRHGRLEGAAVLVV